MKPDTQKYCIIELHSGAKGICWYDRVAALKVVHQLNKKKPKVRYAICAV